MKGGHLWQTETFYQPFWNKKPRRFPQFRIIPTNIFSFPDLLSIFIFKYLPYYCFSTLLQFYSVNIKGNHFHQAVNKSKKPQNSAVAYFE